MRVPFIPLTGGGSYYSTSDEKLQQAIESNANFGKMFIGHEVQEAPVQEEPAQEQPKIKQVNVASLDDAKEYLAEKFGISRTKLRSKAAITAAAEENNIEFTGI